MQTHSAGLTKVEKTTGILLRTRQFRDTSLLVYWCTLDHGIIHTAARAARNPKSPFSGKLDLFYSAEISFARSRSSDLHNLREVVVLDHRQAIQRDYGRVLTASYFVQLVELVAERDTPIPEIYELLGKALDFLSERPGSHAVVQRFELRMAEALGIAQEGKPSHLVLGDLFGRRPGSRAALLEQLDRGR